MKKLVIIVSLLAGSLSTYAQDSLTTTKGKPKDEILRSKKGAIVLPVAGDWRITGGVSGLTGYVGNLFSSNNTYNPASIFSGTNISLGYFKTAQKVYLFNVLVNSQNGTISNYVTNDANPGVSPIINQVKDTKSYAINSISVGFGIQKRSGGQQRFQRFFGYGVGFNYASNVGSIKYGNPCSTTDPYPTSTYASPFNSSFGGSVTYANRITKYNEGTTLGANLYVQAGAEYFFAPKMSLGLLFNAGPRISFTSDGYDNTESLSGSQSVVTKNKFGNSTSISFLTGTGSLFMSLYF